MKDDELKAWRARLSLGEAGMASYLGVPVTTYRKWENGTRSQDASTLRLFEVLRLIEMEGGALHHDLLTLARAAGPAEAPKRRGRKPGIEVTHAPAGPTDVSEHPLAPAQPVEQSTQVPAWLMMASGN